MNAPDALILFGDWCRGDAAAGRKLIQRFSPPLERFFASKVPPEAVDDLLQKTWLALIEANERRCQERTMATGEHDPSLPEVRNFRGYLFGVARHTVLRYYRDHRGQEIDPDVETVEALAPTLSRQLSLKRHVKQLELALQMLPLDLQMLAEARYLEDLSGPELADMLGIPEGTVRSRLSRARRLLDEALERLEHVTRPRSPGRPLGGL